MKTLLVVVFALSIAGMAAAEDRCSGIDHQSLLSRLVMREAWGYGIVYVNRRWYDLPLHDKMLMAIYFKNCWSRQEFVVVLDGYTGRRLARYSPRVGYSNFEGE